MELKMGIIAGATEATITRISVNVGDTVEKEQAILEYETKKGNRVYKATESGEISAIKVSVGDVVKKDDVLFLVGEKDVLTEIFMPKKSCAGDIKITKIEVKVGDKVETGNILFQYELKKGSIKFASPVCGEIVKINFKVGQIVEENDLLFQVKEDKKTETVETKSESLDTNIIKTDILIIGGGPGGYVAGIYAAKHGKKVTLLEKDALGGTCLNVGCIPTKALVKSSEVYHEAMHADVFGIDIQKEAVTPNMEEIINHKECVVDRLVSGVEGLMEKNNIQVIKGLGKFISKTKVEVKIDSHDYIIEATDIIIATGSKISDIPIPGLKLPMVLNSTTALANRKLPESVTIVGGGVIGMEFAFIYNNLGVDVTVVEFMDRLLLMLDKDLSSAIQREAKKKGIKVYTKSKVLEVSKDITNKAIVTFEKNSKKQFVVSENVLVAIGRQPNLDGLNLEITDIEMDPKRRGIKVDNHMKTNVEHVYAIGDVTNIIQLAHVASHQGIIAVDNILGNEKEMHYHAVPNVIFTNPEIASVGLGEDYCKANNIDYKVGKFYYAGNGKAITMEQTTGFVKILKDPKTNVVIGAGLIGADASTLISTLTLAVQNKMTDKELTDTIFPHPTTGETIHEAAMGLGIGTLHS